MDVRTVCLILISVSVAGCGLGDNTDELRSRLDYKVSAIDTTSDSATDTNTETDTGTDTDTDTGTGAVEGTDTPTEDTDTGNGCDLMEWECGEGLNNKDFNLNCNASPFGCAVDGQWCDGEHKCQSCNVNAHCGTECMDCTATQNAATPVCSTDGTTCVECNENADCREGAAPFNSPLGVCTPDSTCTCWVENDTDGCQTDLDCPQDANYHCVRDYDDGLYTHKVCLKECGDESAYENGIGCVDKVAANVWAPATSCFAFDRFGEDCSGNVHLCSVDGSGPLADAACPGGTCTYSCYDTDPQDSWCPTNSCGIQYCE